MGIKMNLKLKPNEFKLEMGCELLTVRTDYPLEQSTVGSSSFCVSSGLNLQTVAFWKECCRQI